MTPKQRRETLADFLEQVVQPALDGAKFDMRRWGRATEGGTSLPPRSTNLKRLSECGFAGCAAGWGFFCPALRKEGIPVRIKGVDNDELGTTFYQLQEFFFGEREWNDRRVFHVFYPRAYEDPRNVTIPEVVARLREDYP